MPHTPHPPLARGGLLPFAGGFMHRTLFRLVAAATAALIALSVGPPAGAVDVSHTDVAAKSAATFTPHLRPNGFKPVALSVHQAGDHMPR